MVRQENRTEPNRTKPATTYSHLRENLPAAPWPSAPWPSAGRHSWGCRSSGERVERVERVPQTGPRVAVRRRSVCEWLHWGGRPSLWIRLSMRVSALL